MEEVLGEEPDVKEQLFEALKLYAAERDVESLAEALPDILITEEHQQLIDSVRYQPLTPACRCVRVVCVSFRVRGTKQSFSRPRAVNKEDQLLKLLIPPPPHPTPAPLHRTHFLCR